MTLEEKQLLLGDLCARLPYGLMFQSYHSECGIEGKGTFDFKVGNDATLSMLKHWCESDNNKPYLRPMSSMTKEEKEEYCNLQDRFLYSSQYPVTDAYEIFDWLNAHHLDYRRLIEKGLALEAPKDMYKTE